MKNYITIAALLAAGAMSANAAEQVTEDFTLKVGEAVALDNEYLLTSDWTLTFSLLANPVDGMNSYGTPLISSESNSTAATQNIQVYASSKNTDNIVVKANNGDDSYTANGMTAIGWPQSYATGEATFKLAYIASSKTLTLDVSVKNVEGTVSKTWTNVTYAGTDTLTQFTTGISQTQLETKYLSTHDTWTLPTGTFTGVKTPFRLLSGFATDSASATGSLNGNTITVAATGGSKLWTFDTSGSWKNSEALETMNEELGTTFSIGDINGLKSYGTGGGSAKTDLTLTFSDILVGEDVVIYLLATSNHGNNALSSVNISGLDIIQTMYATDLGTGFSLTEAYSDSVKDWTLLRIEGTLLEQSVVFGSDSAKNAWGMVAYAPIPEPSAFGLLAGIGALALVASRRRRK